MNSRNDPTEATSSNSNERIVDPDFEAIRYEFWVDAQKTKAAFDALPRVTSSEAVPESQTSPNTYVNPSEVVDIFSDLGGRKAA